VSAPYTFDKRIGINNIPLGFAHFGTVLDHHPLGQKIDKRFVDIHKAQIAEGFGEKACIEKVEYGVLDSPNILVHGHPVFRFIPIEWSLVIPRRTIAKEIPGRLHKGIHGIRLATCRLAAGGQATLTQKMDTFAKGFPPSPLNFASIGRTTGRSLSGTGTAPQQSQ
jgi:hypothetical protein